jgi:ribosomal protein L31E
MIFMRIKQFIARKYRFSEIEITPKVNDYIRKNNE